MKTLLSIFLFLININSSASTQTSPHNNFSIRAGLAFNQIIFKTDKIINDNEDDEKNEVKTQSYGFTTAAS